MDIFDLSPIQLLLFNTLSSNNLFDISSIKDLHSSICFPLTKAFLLNLKFQNQ